MNTSPELITSSFTPKSHPPKWLGIYQGLSREHGFEPLRVEGSLPQDLKGTLYRNGPGTFEIAGQPYHHWFDGDGALSAIRFQEGKAWGASRIIRTQWLNKEVSAGRQLYRSYAQLGKGWRRWFTLPKNPANISVLPWKGQLLALWEAGLPIAINPKTLDCLGETTLKGKVGPTFSAHPHVMGGTVFNFGIRYGIKFRIDLYTLGQDVKGIGSIPLAFPTLIHDFAVTENYLVFFVPPVRLKLMELLSGMRSFTENLSWEPERGTEVIVVPLETPEAPIRFHVPAFFQWHFVNAWEDRSSSKNLVVDSVRYDDHSTNVWFGRAPFDAPTPPPKSRYVRSYLDLNAKRMQDEILSGASCEFPSINPGEVASRHQLTWLLSFEPKHGSDGLHPVLCAFKPNSGEWKTVPLESEAFPSEAVVIGETEWVLSLVYEGNRNASYVAVIHKNHPEDGPIAKVWFDHPIPLTFHGAWGEYV